MKKSLDVIVLGLGAMGSAALYQLSKTGQNVIGIDQFSPPHIYGSTHGDTRITRQAIGEGEEYVPLVLRSYEIWKELENQSKKDLLTITGGLIMASPGESSNHHGSNKFLETTIAAAEKYNISHTVLDAKDIKKRFPQFGISGNETGYYEDKAGFLRPENCVEAQLSIAEKNGADIHRNEKVLEIISESDKVTIKTTKGEYITEQLIITAGPWVSQFLDKKYKEIFKVYRQVLYWFDIEDSYDRYTSNNFPIYIWEFSNNEGDFIYGFPAVDGKKGGVKVATEQYSQSISPDEVTREVSQVEIKEMYDRYVKGKLIGVSEKCVKAKSCLYTVTPDYNFVIDTHPSYKNIIIASPCSGHGFKHSAAIGEVLSQMATKGKSSLDISAFNLDRLTS